MMNHDVLIIEDDATLLRGLQDNFESRGYRVRTATDGEAGLDAAIASRPDLILLDIMLPKMNGFEVCCSIRERELDMPIIMLTAKGQEEDIIRGLNLGADDYVTKPFNVRELFARVNAFLRRRPNAESDVFRFGDCELDVASHKLFRQSREVALTAKEFRLLEYFVERSGRALTRQDIMSSVWGSSVIVTARSVDRCVTTLRAKIEPDPRHPTYIHTIRDIGYRFEIPDAASEDSTDAFSDRKKEGTLAESDTDLTCGGRLGRYEIQSELGRGGMAVVFQARDVRLDRDVAIKVLHPSSARDVDLRVRFEREAKAIAALSHPNIRAIYDVSREGGKHFAVMELLEGETLRDRLGRGQLEWNPAVEIAMAVCQGLAAAHDKGIVHRDIKPGNILLTNDGNVKILDFGLALLVAGGSDLSHDADSCRSTKTSPGKLLGTVNYMSPEQVRGQVADARSDLFSLGAVLYEMLSGTPPFCRKTPADTMAAILHEDPPQLSSLEHGISNDLDAVIYQCLRKSLNDRFQSAADLRQALCEVART